MKCILCNLDLNQFTGPRTREYYTYWPCLCGHYRVFLNCDSLKVEDYTEAGSFCIRRFFSHGASDVIIPSNSIRRLEQVDSIFSDAEVLTLVEKYTKLSVMS